MNRNPQHPERRHGKHPPLELKHARYRLEKKLDEWRLRVVRDRIQQWESHGYELWLDGMDVPDAVPLDFGIFKTWMEKSGSFLQVKVKPFSFEISKYVLKYRAYVVRVILERSRIGEVCWLTIPHRESSTRENQMDVEGAKNAQVEGEPGKNGHELPDRRGELAIRIVRTEGDEVPEVSDGSSSGAEHFRPLFASIIERYAFAGTRGEEAGERAEEKEGIP